MVPKEAVTVTSTVLVCNYVFLWGKFKHSMFVVEETPIELLYV